MARKKHRKQAEVRTLNNVFHSKQERVSDRIQEYFSGNANYTVEIGCGNGEYTIALANEYPRRNFIGIDRAGARIWNAATRAQKEQVPNAAFLLTYVERLIFLLPSRCVESLWIPFPNPLPRRRNMKAMLVHPRFLLIYKQFLLPDAVINLKTDDDILYQYTLDLIKGNNLILHRHSCDTRTDSTLTGEVLLPTRFEKHQSEKGKTIKYVAFSLREDSFAGMPLPDFQHLLKK